MILTSSLFKVVAYLAAWRAGVPTLTSSLRPRRYNHLQRWSNTTKPRGITDEQVVSMHNYVSNPIRKGMKDEIIRKHKKSS